MVRRLYRTCEQLNVAIVSISHRPKHVGFHSRILTLAGSGHWDIQTVDPSLHPSTILGDLSDIEPETPPSSPVRICSPQTPNSRDPPGTPTERSQDAATSRSRKYITRAREARPMPTKSNLCRIMMIGRVLLPKLSLSNRAVRLVLAEVAAIVLTASLTARVLSALPGQLQALVVQADRAGWIRLMLTATGFRLLSTVIGHWHNWASHHLSVELRDVLTHHIADQAMGDDACFYSLLHVDKRIADLETRAVTDVFQCSVCKYFLRRWCASAVSLTSVYIATRCAFDADGLPDTDHQDAAGDTAVDLCSATTLSACRDVRIRVRRDGAAPLWGS